MTLKEFEDSLPELIRNRVLAIRKPYSAGKIAMVNHEDNFILYFSGVGMDVVIESFMLLDDMKQVSPEVLDWFNKLGDVAFRVPIIRETLKKIYAELR